jgi:uncharacterized protein (DUF433 family)
MDFDWRDHFVQDANICHGRTTFKGTRVLLRQILADLAAGTEAAEIIENYPSLTPDHIRAAAAFAAERTLALTDEKALH